MPLEENVRTGTIGQPLQTTPNLSLTPEELQWGQYCHFAGVFGLIGTLICWLVKKDTSMYVDVQGKSAVNFHLTNLIMSFLCAITFVGIPIAFLVTVYGIVFSILAGSKVKDGEMYKYPFSFNLIK